MTQALRLSELDLPITQRPVGDSRSGCSRHGALIEPSHQSAWLGNNAIMQRWLKRARSLSRVQRKKIPSDTGNLPGGQHQAIPERSATPDRAAGHLTLADIAELVRGVHIVAPNVVGLPSVDVELDGLLLSLSDKLDSDARHDPLTGLLTRPAFISCLQHLAAEARRQRSGHVLIFLDIVQFKLINNTCGYEAGDRFLRELALQLRGRLGDSAEIGRLGADRFAVLAPLTTEKAGYLLATELKRMVEASRFDHAGQRFVTSAVVALVGIDQHTDHALEPLRMAEAAAELCKQAGRTDVQLVRPGNPAVARRDQLMSWVTRINKAMDEDNLRIRCQKIMPIDPASGVLPHYEVLLTVIDRNGQHLLPADFIKAAEQYGRMAAVDRWVIQTVLTWMAAHPAELQRFGGFSINLSGHSLNDESFIDFLFEALVRHAVPRDRLIFEITETTAVANLEDAADFINEMRRIGCRFSLDDFGVGQFSYGYLKRLPVDFIKIDGTFIEHIARDEVDRAVVRSITEMGHFLNKKVIAEHVSSANILKVIRDIGVDYAQGFHMGEQVMLDQLAAVLKVPA
ncbi:EAL domain-containing protein [Halopseudomonas nanhaiensis]|uniref:EAL domain-containing protein n=1 Tax=Halopseudomonas nanhaiensis TaxID=2830842 RepID=UPI001CBE3651|nr:EAL domain-containing protein [Halopseudomonas nanhaiensis]UAW98919.1 EAL domain-containing protein [Halopseudomonas nanhaiensis]